MDASERVRLLIGDVDESVLSDAEVTDLIANRSVLDSDGGTASVNIPAAAADAAGAIAAHYARDYNFSEDGQQFQRAQRVGHYLALERELRSRSGGYSVPVTD